MSHHQSNRPEDPFLLHDDDVLGVAQLSIAKHRFRKENSEFKEKVKKLQGNLKRKLLDMEYEKKEMMQISYDLEMQKIGKDKQVFEYLVAS